MNACFLNEKFQNHGILRKNPIAPAYPVYNGDLHETYGHYYKNIIELINRLTVSDLEENNGKLY